MFCVTARLPSACRAIKCEISRSLFPFLIQTLHTLKPLTARMGNLAYRFENFDLFLHIDG